MEVNNDKSMLNTDDIENIFNLDVSQYTDSIPYIEKNKLEIYENPLYLTINNKTTYIDDEYKNELFTENKFVYVIFAKNNNTNTVNFMRSIINRPKLYESEFLDLKNYVSILKAPISFLSNISHYNLHKKVNYNDIKDLLSFNDITSKYIIITIMPNVTELNGQQYINLYDINKNYSDYINVVDIYNYYEDKNQLYNDIISDKIRELIYNSNDMKYWKDKKNTKISITKYFINRKLNLKTYNIKTSKIDEEDEDVEKDLDNPDNNVGNYLLTLENANYIDLKIASHDGINDLYLLPKILKNNDLIVNGAKTSEKEYLVNHLLNIRSEIQLYDTIMLFLLNKDYCHLLANNDLFFTKFNDFISKYMPILKYVWSYIWISFYIEECKIGTNSVHNIHRHIFDINTASKLPIFPYTNTNIFMNPYLTLLTSKESVGQNNLYGLNCLEQKNNYTNGIVTLDQFVKNMNLFITGDDNINIFKYFDFNMYDSDGKQMYDKYGNKLKRCCITGSIMTACCQKNTVLNNVYRENSKDNLEIYRNLYENSDIDVACNANNIYDYYKIIDDLVLSIKNTLKEAHGNNKKHKIITTHKKSVLILVNTDYIKAYFSEFDDISYVVANVNKPQIKNRFIQKYLEIKNNIEKKHISKMNSNEKKEYIKSMFIDVNNKIALDSDIKVIFTQNKIKYQNNISHNEYYIGYDDKVISYENINKYTDEALNDKEYILKISESIKTRVEGQGLGLKKHFELFRVKTENFFNPVAKFHLPCVRAYYSGDNVYMVPSFITAMMTYTNIDYKYISGNTDPITIILKNLKRGYGTILNTNEKNLVANFVKNDPKIISIFKSKIDTEKVLYNSDRTIESIIYSTRNNAANKKYADTINSDYKLYSEFNNKNYNFSNSSINLLSLKTIDNNGFIIPINLNIVKEAFEIINNTN